MRRALVLVLLGIFLRSQGRPQTYFTFEDVLTQIGLGYVFLFLLAHARRRARSGSPPAAVLVGYWAAFVLYPLPPAGFDTALRRRPRRLAASPAGFAAHWDKNTNLANRVDQWFLNLFPRETSVRLQPRRLHDAELRPVAGDDDLRAARRRAAPRRRRAIARSCVALLAYGAAGIALGAALHFAGICPLVKRIWTPSWAIFSAGWAALFLALFYWWWTCGAGGAGRFPFLVVGMNSIAMYVIVHVGEHYTAEALRTHLGKGAFQAFGARVRANPRRRRVAADLLADAVLDVPPEDLHPDLR